MVRLTTFVALIAVISIAVLGSCSSDSDTPLGASFVADSLILSNPGEVFTDTLEITGDFSTVVNSFASGSDRMRIGVKNNVFSSMVIRFDLSSLDTSRTVTRAQLSLREVGDDGVTQIAALFFELEDTVRIDNPVPELMLGDTIADDTGINTDRIMQLFPSTYLLDPATVQNWVDSLGHTGIAVVFNDPDSSKSLLFGTSENGASDKRPFLTLSYATGVDDVLQSDDVIIDGTFFTDQNTSPPNSHAVADGETRRIFFPIDLSGFDTRLFLHDATLTVYLNNVDFDPGVVVKTETLLLYAPESTDPNDPGFLTGPEIAFIDADLTQCLDVPPFDATPECEWRIVFPVKLQVERFLTDPDQEYGFVLRYGLEGSDPRRTEFFQSTASEFVRPFYKLITSTPAEFPES